MGARSLKYFLNLYKQTSIFVPTIYALVAASWIFFSDRMLASLVRTPELLTQLQTYKGWLFVAVTTILLALLIHWRQRALNELNATLERRVQARTAALACANAELEQSLDHLKRAQNELVQSAKLAAMGALVAGVAHELNTPIGNCLLTASTFAEDTGTLAKVIANGDLTRSALEAYISSAQLSSELVVRNLNRAASLIYSFKQVAVNRESSVRCEFSLAKLVNDILAMERVQGQSVHISAAVPPEILLDSYPGVLSQVIQSLLDNAIVHGLEGMHDDARLAIVARQSTAEEVALIVSDNGKGIAQEHLDQVFDPFFTTRFGQGGSGLGLHIVHQMVNRVLGGRIEVHTGAATASGVGSEFMLLLPVHPAELPQYAH
jgi:C4-dicarboxylate-specific signal transduction histidine kinase